MPSEKEVKYMENHKAKISRKEKSTSLILELKEQNLEIQLTEDKPIEVKKVFNTLILQLKKGEFKFELEKDKEDLYFFICEEYIKQLNIDLANVYKELVEYNLLEVEESE